MGWGDTAFTSSHISHPCLILGYRCERCYDANDDDPDGGVAKSLQHFFSRKIPSYLKTLLKVMGHHCSRDFFFDNLFYMYRKETRELFSH